QLFDPSAFTTHPRPPHSALFPYTTLFRSQRGRHGGGQRRRHLQRSEFGTVDRGGHVHLARQLLRRRPQQRGQRRRQQRVGHLHQGQPDGQHQGQRDQQRRGRHRHDQRFGHRQRRRQIGRAPCRESRWGAGGDQQL